MAIASRFMRRAKSSRRSMKRVDGMEEYRIFFWSAFCNTRVLRDRKHYARDKNIFKYLEKNIYKIYFIYWIKYTCNNSSIFWFNRIETIIFGFYFIFYILFLLYRGCVFYIVVVCFDVHILDNLCNHMYFFINFQYKLNRILN